MGLIAGIAVAAAGAVAGGIQASQQNSAVNRAKGEQKEQAALQQAHIEKAKNLQIAQLGRQIALELAKVKNESEQIRGKLRVAAADSGVGMGGSFVALDRQAAFDRAFNSAILDQNYQDAVLRIKSDAEASGLNLQQNLAANLSNLNMMRQNPILAGFSGGVQGFSTGLNIAQGVHNLNGTHA